jgi:predicted PurR-regulated permease PerM
MQSIHQDIIRQLFTLMLILALGFLIFWKLLPFMSGLLGAITLYIISEKAMHKLINKGWKPSVAAALIMVISFVGILVPVGLVVLMLSNKVRNALSKTDEVIAVLKEGLSTLENSFNIELFSSFNSNDIVNWVSHNFSSVIGNTLNIFITLSILYFLLYYMLVKKRQFITVIYRYFPMRSENIRAIGKEIDNVVRSNAIGIPMIAIIQGFVALLGFYIFGVPNPWFWFVITAIGSMIPIVGTAIGILPAAIILFVSEQHFQGFGIILYGLLVVGTTDNLFRIIVQKKLSNIHPIVTLIGIVVGVPLFGFIGLIFGPLLISLFLLLLRIYKEEFVQSI